MYMTLFALASLAGACVAWRNNPLYSNRATIRFVLVVGLCIAAVVGAIVAVINVTSGLSMAVQFASIMGLCLFATMALIWVIMKLSTPSTALPPTVRMVNVHRAKLVPWLQRAAWITLAFAVLGVLLPGDAKYLVLTFGGMFVFLAIILLFAGNIAAVEFDRSLTLVEEHPWVHWQYTPDQWKAWTEAEVTRAAAKPPQLMWRRDWPRLCIPLVAIAIGMFAFNPGPWLFDTLAVLASWAFILGLIELAKVSDRAVPRRLRSLLSKVPPEAYLGPGGVYADGVYTQWQNVSNYLLQADVDDREPRSLAFLFERMQPGTTGPVRIWKSVLLPSDAHDDIERLQSALSAAVPSARISLSAPAA
jgi:hypothetical protein